MYIFKNILIVCVVCSDKSLKDNDFLDYAWQVHFPRYTLLWLVSEIRLYKIRIQI